MLFASAEKTTHLTSEIGHTNLNGIDLVKFLCAIMVFTIHAVPFRDGISIVTDYINFAFSKSLCRVAVPFYFVCSGFFLFRKMPIYDPNAEIITNYCYKLLRLLALWTLLLFIGETEHLWYLGATVVAVVLLSLCLHFRLKLSLIWLLACLLYGIGLLGDSYNLLITSLVKMPIVGKLYGIYTRFFDSTRNGAFMGFVFVLLGASLSQQKVSMKPMTAAIGLILSLTALLAETFLLKYFNILVTYNMYILLLPAVYFLFCFAYTLPLKERGIYKNLRNIGIWFYFLHLFVAKIIYRSCGWIEQHFSTGIMNPVFVFSLLITLLIAIYIDWLSGKEKYKWLNWLIA